MSIPGAGSGCDVWFADAWPFTASTGAALPRGSSKIFCGFELGPIAVPVPRSQGIAGQRLSAIQLEYL